jgi:succinyl-diaminopimelate desuccinylase
MFENENEALLHTVQELIKIKSTANNPEGLRAAYHFIQLLLAQSGKDLTVEEFERNGKPSLLAYRRGARPDKFHIILNGHLDVVEGLPEQFEPAVKDGKLHGRGACDMKAAAVVLTQLFCDYVDRVPYDLALQIVTDEESAGHDGAMYQVEQGVRADFVLCGDCGRTTSNYVIANEAKGMVGVKLAFRGRSAHGAYPWQGDNAAVKAAQFIQRLHDFYPTPAEATGETTLAVTSIVTTGSSYTQIPAEATAFLNARYTSGDPHFASQAAFTARLAEIDPNAEIIEFVDFSAPMYTHPDDPLLQQLKTAAEQVENHEFSFIKNNGTSDGRHFGAVGVPACEFGIPGEGQHGPEEYIPLAALYTYRDTLRNFLTDTLTPADTEQPAEAVSA